MNEEFLKWVVFASAVLVVADFLVSLYVNHYILPQVEAQLKNCKLVADTKALWGTTGLLGKMQRSAMVYATLTSTRRMREKGMVDIDEVSRVSRRHRLWICVPMWVGCGSLVAAFIALALLGRLW